MTFAIIVAEDAESGIGKDGILPWNLPNELKYFAEVTTSNEQENTLIMGRVTWESIPESRRPLKNRRNIILSRSEDYDLPDGAELATSLDQALQMANPDGKTFVIGGGRVFHEAIMHEECTELYITKIEKDFECDTFFPKIYESEFELSEQSDLHEENNIRYRFLKYTKVNI